MIAYDKQGHVFALTEGAELLLHDGETEGPMWRKTLDAPIVGLGINAEVVTAVSESGLVMSWSATSGADRSTGRFDGRVTTACVDVGTGRVVAITERAPGSGAIVELRGGAAKTLAEHTARAIAIAPDGSVLAATETELVLVSPDGKRTTREQAGVRALAYHPRGFWLIGLAGKLLRWDASSEPAHVTNLPPNSQLEHIACSDRALAVAWNRHMVAVLEWPSRDTLGSLQYLEKTVEGLDFGPWPWLGVSLNEGDGNKFHLENANLHRSDTHPGRQHHSWLVSVGGAEKKKPQPRNPAPATVEQAPAPSAGRSLAMLIAIAAIVLVIVFVLR